jgi:hypothetical protein
LIVDVSHINLSIPLNTGVVGGIVTQVPLCLPTDISFEDLFSRVCAKMDLLPLEALLGYKFSSDRKNDPAYQLANEDDLHRAIVKAIEKVKRARSKDVIIEIHNLVRNSILHCYVCSKSSNTSILSATCTTISSCMWIEAWCK